MNHKINRRTLRLLAGVTTETAARDALSSATEHHDHATVTALHTKAQANGWQLDDTP